MKKYTISLFGICAAAGLLFTTPAKAQIMFNNGAEVYVTTGAIVQVNGGLQDDNIVAGPGVIDNEGDIRVTTNPGPGFIWISNGATMQGNGHYHLDNNWINDATFTHNGSTVEMYGATEEYITSNNATVTTFDTLLLDGAGAYGTPNARKTQTLDANVAAALELKDRDLYTRTHNMNILTPTVSAVTNNPTAGSEGFVQSDGVGRLSRVTNSTGRYFFPVGADSGTLRYRPVYMTPKASNPDTFKVRLANYNASNDADSTDLVDSTICTVNKLFYHQIDRTKGSVDNSDIDIYYNAGTDGTWQNLAQWNTPTPTLWNNMGAVTATVALPYNDNLKTNWGNFTNDPYILANQKPGPPILNCNGICANSNGTFTVSGSGSSYTWNAPPGTTILSGQGTDSVTVQWNGNPGIISVVANSVGGCTSAPATCNVTVNPSPVAGFDTVSTGLYNNTWGFTDTSTVKGTITSWSWNFGDGSTSTQQDPTHFYNSAGTYIITEVVTNSSGCTGRVADTIVIPEAFSMPNVITPNGDGKNDVLTISCSGVSSFSLQIFNRWGQEVFSTNSVNIAWDGRTNAGVKVSDGTYYYVVKATSTSGKNWDRDGFITVLSSGVSAN
jgi:gliding motility-associated-like protein